MSREALAAGELVCIFPEGGISRSGQLQRFKPGVLEIQRDTGAPIIPVWLDEIWGSIFSFRGGKFFWKWPQPEPRRVSIWFGKPIYNPPDIHRCGRRCRTWAPTPSRAESSGRWPCPAR